MIEQMSRLICVVKERLRERSHRDRERGHKNNSLQHSHKDFAFSKGVNVLGHSKTLLDCPSV